MFRFFNPPYTVRRTPVTLPIYDYLMKQIKHESQKTINFYQTNQYQVPNTHRLAKLVYEFENHMDLSAESLVDWVRANTHRLCNAYGFTSSISKGGIQDGELYNPNNPEVYICVEYEIDIKKCVDQWDRLRPLRVVSHDFTDFSYTLPNGRYLSTEKGVVVVTIDLALLALQFQQWWKTARYVESEKLYLPHTHFVNRYPLCNLLSSHMDQVIFNRFSNLVRDAYTPPTRSNNPYMTVDYSQRIDDAHRKLLAQFKSSPKDWMSYLASLPSLSRGDYYQSILFPDTAPTLNIKWALVLSKLKIIETMLALDQWVGNTTISSSDRYAMSVDLRVLRNDRSLALFLPDTIMQRIESVYTAVSQTP